MAQEGDLSLSALLSQALVAFTIECDNEGEHRIPHRTTNHGAPGHGDGAWLVSLAMFENCMRYLAGQPMTVAALASWARTPTNLDGMRRWGYITIDGTARKVHHGSPGPDAVLDATPRGLRAREVWMALPGVVEQRWRDRFGDGQVAALRSALLAIVTDLDPGLPDCLPILRQDLASRPRTCRPGPSHRTCRRCRCPRCCPGSCSPSPSSMRRTAACRWPSAPTCCACWAPMESACGTCRR